MLKVLKAQAYCPASISLLFKKCVNDNIALTGSVGIGFTVDCGITAIAEKSDVNEIFFNSERINFPTVLNTIELITKKKIKVSLTAPLPLGSGFGLSGGGSLATAYAVNQLYNIGKTGKELALAAHTAEINNRTGLGTVGTQIMGGFLVKTAPGLPVIAIPVNLTGKKITAVIIDRLITSEILSNQNTLEKINGVAEEIINKITLNPHRSLDDYIDLSYEFASRSGLIQNNKVADVIRQIRSRGGHATMTILGNVVLTTHEEIDFPYPTHLLTIVNDKIKLL